MNEGYSSKLTAHMVQKGQSKVNDFVLFCECKIKVAYTLQAYTVSAAEPAGVRSRRAKSPYIQSHSNVTYDI